MTEHMTDTSPTPSEEPAVSGGGPSASDLLESNPVRQAAMKLELLSAETREGVLSRMDPTIAQQIRDYMTSLTRPHGQFSTDVATRRRMIKELADRTHVRRTAQASQVLDAIDGGTPHAAPAAPGQQPAAPAATPATPEAALDQLRSLHPAAIARAMQGERAEAWAIVLDRLDINARAALQLYLDATARAAIEDARSRQAELAANSPALLATVVAAIARTVVPRALREHHQLLSTTPLGWADQARPA